MSENVRSAVEPLSNQCLPSTNFFPQGTIVKDHELMALDNLRDFRASVCRHANTAHYQWQEHLGRENPEHYQFELEIRFGVVNFRGGRAAFVDYHGCEVVQVRDAPHRFDAFVEPWIFLALFQETCQRATVIENSNTQLTWVERDDTHRGVRVVHDVTNSNNSASASTCVRELKTKIESSEWLGPYGGGIDLRISLQREKFLANVNNCTSCPHLLSATQNGVGVNNAALARSSSTCFVQRERRSLRLSSVVVKGRSCPVHWWRLDYTRVGNTEHQLELELDIDIAHADMRRWAATNKYRGQKSHEVFANEAATQATALVANLYNTIELLQQKHCENVQHYKSYLNNKIQ